MQTVETLARQALAGATKRELPLWISVAKTFLGWAEVEFGCLEQGIDTLEKQRGFLERAQLIYWLPTYLCWLTEAHLRAANLQDAKSCLAQARDFSRRGGNSWYEVECLRLEGRLAARLRKATPQRQPSGASSRRWRLPTSAANADLPCARRAILPPCSPAKASQHGRTRCCRPNLPFSQISPRWRSRRCQSLVVLPPQRLSALMALGRRARGRPSFRGFEVSGGTMPKKAWSERYEGGSPEAEQRIFEGYVRDILRVQLKYQKKAGRLASSAPRMRKCFLVWPTPGFAFSPKFPTSFESATFSQTRIRGHIRFSNASGACRPRYHAGSARRSHPRPDFRSAIAGSLRCELSDRACAQCAPVRCLQQGLGRRPRAADPAPDLAPWPLRALRTIGNLLMATRRRVRSLALESYWSRGPILWGDAGPVRYLLRPAADAPRHPSASRQQPTICARRLPRGFAAAMSPLISTCSPSSARGLRPSRILPPGWKEKVSRPILVATLTLPQQDVDAAEGGRWSACVDQFRSIPGTRPTISGRSAT